MEIILKKLEALEIRFTEQETRLKKIHKKCTSLEKLIKPKTCKLSTTQINKVNFLNKQCVPGFVFSHFTTRFTKRLTNRIIKAFDEPSIELVTEGAKSVLLTFFSNLLKNTRNQCFYVHKPRYFAFQDGVYKLIDSKLFWKHLKLFILNSFTQCLLEGTPEEILNKIKQNTKMCCEDDLIAIIYQNEKALRKSYKDPNID